MVGGTSLWLQGPEQPPGDGWTYAFQFGADLAAERGDGAVCYGWTSAQGRAALAGSATDVFAANLLSPAASESQQTQAASEFFLSAATIAQP